MNKEGLFITVEGFKDSFKKEVAQVIRDYISENHGAVHMIHESDHDLASDDKLLSIISSTFEAVSISKHVVNETLMLMHLARRAQILHTKVSYLLNEGINIIYTDFFDYTLRKYGFGSKTLVNLSAPKLEHIVTEIFSDFLPDTALWVNSDNDTQKDAFIDGYFGARIESGSLKYPWYRVEVNDLEFIKTIVKWLLIEKGLIDT